MNILLASSEVHPFSKTGGLADMVGALAKSLARLGHRVGLVTPLYTGIPEKHPALKPFDWQMKLPMGKFMVEGSVWTLEPEPGLTIYFVDQASYFWRKALYGESGKDYEDNAERFTFLSKAVVHLARYLPWRPEVIHIHDWQVGLVPALVRQQVSEGWGNAPRTCLTIHNLAYQGAFAAEKFPVTNLPRDYFTISGLEFYGGINFLKAAICYSDIITTVSPRYAREITTEEYGCGLDAVLRPRTDRIHGILNGVDYDEWNPSTDKYLPIQFDSDCLDRKAVCKAKLQERLNLTVDPTVPLFGTVSRLADQKGVDIKLGALEEMLSTKMQFVLLGSGQPEFERAYEFLARRHPGKVVVKIGYDNELAHQIEAGSDFFLMPSRFEPCGLNQLYSLRYGTIPVVRATGGLDDSVVDIAEGSSDPDGIKFYEYSARALSKAIRKALALYQAEDLMREYRLAGMQKNFSWERTSSAYLDIYNRSKLL